MAMLKFVQVLNTGSDDVPESDQVQRAAKSVADDVIFTTTRGRTKPGKHLCLGLALKSLTGSRRIVEIMNRFGHSVSYHTVESLETQLASEIIDRKESIPDGLSCSTGLMTSLAWDNYDENNETLYGAGTLHDTVGICYQNVPEARAESVDISSQEHQTNPATHSSR